MRFFFMIRPLISNNQPVKEHSKRYSNKNRNRNQTIQTVNCLASDQLLDVLPVDCFPLLIGHQLSFMLCHSLLPLSSFRILLIFWLSLLSVLGALYPGVLQDSGWSAPLNALLLQYFSSKHLSFLPDPCYYVLACLAGSGHVAPVWSGVHTGAIFI